MWDCKTSKMSPIPACRAQRLRLIRSWGGGESQATQVPRVAAACMPTPSQAGGHEGKRQLRFYFSSAINLLRKVTASF